MFVTLIVLQPGLLYYKKPCIISYHVTFLVIISFRVRLMGSKTGWYFRSVFKKLILCSVQLCQPVRVTLKWLYTQLNNSCAHYMEVRGQHQPLFNLVSYWVYTKSCQGTFKRMKSHLAKLKILFCDPHNFVGELWHNMMWI